MIAWRFFENLINIQILFLIYEIIFIFIAFF